MFKYILIIISISIVFNSCVSVHYKNISKITCEVVPSPLVVENNQIPIKIIVNIPPKTFNPSKYLRLQPFFESIDYGQSMYLKEDAFQGEKAKKNYYTVIPYKTGSSITIIDTVDYYEGLENYNLYLKFNITDIHGYSFESFYMCIADSILIK